MFRFNSLLNGTFGREDFPNLKSLLWRFNQDFTFISYAFYHIFKIRIHFWDEFCFGFYIFICLYSVWDLFFKISFVWDNSFSSAIDYIAFDLIIKKLNSLVLYETLWWSSSIPTTYRYKVTNSTMRTHPRIKI